jgi:hypothetical protein
LFVKRIRTCVLALVQHLKELRQLRAEVRPVLGSAFLEPQAEGTRGLENAGVVGKEAKQHAHEQEFERVAGVAARLEQVVQLPHLFRGADVDEVLRLDLLRAVAGNEAEVAHLLVQFAQPELDRGIGFEVVEPEVSEIGDEDVARQVAVGQAVEIIGSLRERALQVLARALVLDQQHALPERIDAAMLELAAGAGDFHLLLEDRDPPPVDAEDVEEAVPEALSLGAFRPLALPLAGEPERAVLDLVPGRGHGRRSASNRMSGPWHYSAGLARRTGARVGDCSYRST